MVRRKKYYPRTVTVRKLKGRSGGSLPGRVLYKVSGGGRPPFITVLGKRDAQTIARDRRKYLQLKLKELGLVRKRRRRERRRKR